MSRKLPLEGIRIVEVGVWHAGPGASAILGDLGAEVIKIESPVGDPERYHGSFGPIEVTRAELPDWSLLFEMSNRNKTGIAVDMKAEEGREILAALVATADVFLCNLRTSARPRLGIDYDSIRALKPNIVYASATGFGPRGEKADDGGFDPMGQAISGMLFLAGHDEPTLQQMILLDQITAIVLSQAVVVALLERERTGHGGDVHASLYGAAVNLMYANVLATSVHGEEIDVSWRRAENSALRTTFRCADGKWIIGTNHPEEKYWPAFCEAIERTDLTHDLRFATKQDRLVNRAELIALLDELMLSRTQADWVAAFRAHGVLFAPVNRISDVLQDKQALENGYIVDYEHRALGSIRIPGSPVIYGNHPTVGTQSEAPSLGEHTDSVLAALGVTPDRIDELRGAGIVK
ncbi:CoA transferase [Arthrobacter sp. NPDC089319]|uniref:CaiB/BaiF CoA transferase family protein n=1 Tax=Arthrobacter sp. NPDC089319 TaxID=3155915 RepID=UPI0034496DE9